MKKGIFGFDVRDITEIAMLCAMAILLDRFIRIGVGATGGSINICMVPLYVIALRHGWFKGLISGGIVFGLSSCLLDEYGIQTYPLEYFIAFGCIAILGIFGRLINKLFQKDNPKGVAISYGILIACIGVCAVIRWFMASIDSVIFYDYAFGPALVYNAPYVFFSALGVGVIVSLLLPTIKIVNNLYPTKYLSYIN